MEMIEEDIVIVGAGIAGLSTALGLHRLGLKCIVLETSNSLRVTGFALTLWTNAWRALDALGVADSLRQNYPSMARIQVASADSHSSPNSTKQPQDRSDYESRCVRRKELLEILERELPNGTIRYSSKVVSIDISRYHKLLHLADGSTIQTKVLLGCDGVNSIVAKQLGLQRPVHSGRSAIRGFAEFSDGYNFPKQFNVYFGGGLRFGFVPCYGNCLYWFCTYYSSDEEDKEMEDNPAKMKLFVLSKMSKVSKEAADIVERTELGSISCSPLKLRVPWNLLTGNIARENMSVAGDALHPMTPDIGQGGCSALEDGVILARCLGEAFLNSPREEYLRDDDEEEEEYERIKKGLEKYSDGRRWRSFFLISIAYVMGAIQQSDGKVINFLRQKFLSKFLLDFMWKMADYPCGKLVVS